MSQLISGRCTYSTNSVINLNTNNYFNYKQSFNGRHDLDALVGMSFQNRNYEFSNAAGEQFPSDAYKKLSSAASKTDATTTATSSSLLSYFARLNYKFDDKYLIALSSRIDGSSRFGANHRYGFFPAGSVGWIINKESFLQNVNWLSFLKLKASYGVTGNENIGIFRYK